jgi:short-subunit dehydrogenase
MELKQRVIMVTGGSRGIGAEAARQLAAAGAQVVLAARDRALLEQNAAALRAQGGSAWALELDVTSEASVQTAVQATLDRFGHIDVLINNAGNGGTLGLLLDQAPDHTRRMFEVHVLGAERMTRAVLPGMLARRQGRIVMVASAVGYVPMPGAAAYSAAKAAVLALAEALRGELRGSGVELHSFSPPHTQTEAGKAWPLQLPHKFSPDEAARALLRTLRADRQEVLAGHTPLLWLRRLSPRWASSMMRGMGLHALRRLEPAQLGPG